jgi:hypothetical protein
MPMRRVYTDNRFPDFQIVNNGSGTFEVWEGSQISTTFESWENPDGTVSEPFAARRAKDYFDAWAKTDLTGEFERQLMDVSPEAMDTLERSPTASEIDTLMAMERVEADPTKKEQLRQQLLNLMRQEESLARAAVNHLLGL